MPLSTKVALSVDASLTDASVDLTTVSAPLSVRKALRMLSGTGAGQADKAWWDTRTLAASATEDLDLAGTLLDPVLKTAMTFARVKGLFVAAAAGNANNVVVGAAAANPWATLLNATGTVTLRPGAFLFAGAGAADAIGWAVTAGTGDLLKVANSGAGSPVTYDIVVIGCSA